jgi:cobalt-zinc-cadmium efflux system outer membrane protein
MNTATKINSLKLALILCLTSCASLPIQPSDSSIETLLQDRSGPSVKWSGTPNLPIDKTIIDELLLEPLSPNGAVRIAMLRSPKLLQEYARLGLARADVLEATQLSNPGISLLRQNENRGGGVERTLEISLPLIDLIVLPIRKKLAHADFERARFDIAQALFDIALNVESAWYSYVGAQQVADMRTAIANTAQVSADLAERFYAAGNITELQLNQERAAASEARIEAGAAKVKAEETRLTLNNLMGLDSNESSWKALDRLPLPVTQEDEPIKLIDMAHERNLQLLAARQQVLVMQTAYQSTRHWRWLGGTEIGYERKINSDGSRLSGPSLHFELPIFNQGQAKLSRSQAFLAQAQARLRKTELSIENSIRANANTVRTYRDTISIFRDSLIPQRKTVLMRSQQEHNFMLIGAFELLQAKSKEYKAYQGYLEAIRDYWKTRVELTRSVGERLPSDASVTEHAPSLKDILNSKNSSQDTDQFHHDSLHKKKNKNTTTSDTQHQGAKP